MDQTRKRSHDDEIQYKPPKYKAIVQMQSADEPQTSFNSSAGNKLSCSDAFTLGKKISEDEFKSIYDVKSNVMGKILIALKDEPHNHVAGLFSTVHCCIMQILHDSGIETAFIKWVSEKSFLSWNCSNLPIDVAIHRLSTHPDSEETSINGKSLHPLTLEMFLNDEKLKTKRKMSCKSLKQMKIHVGSIEVSGTVLENIELLSIVAFEVIEKYWKSKNIDLVNLKLGFGFHPTTKIIVISSLVYNSKWELKHSNRGSLMDNCVVRSKQVDLKTDHRWVKDSVEQFVKESKTSNVRIFLITVAEKYEKENELRESLDQFAVSLETYTLPSFKSVQNLTRIISEVEAESDSVPTLLATIGNTSSRVNLYPILSDMTCIPIVNLQNASKQDLSSLSYGIHAYSVAHFANIAAHVLSQHDTRVWCKLRVSKFQKSLQSLK